ncbi:MAG: sodium-translocating pyrophosphatase [Candidatus Hodarchaeales archaeon]|jgi:K(+)-stimulated pyrophosphate-energized sodium pump
MLELSDIFRILDPDLNLKLIEIGALLVVFAVAAAGLIYAYWLRKGVLRKDTGTPEEQRISSWIEEGANAYLKKQFKTVIFMVFILTFFLFLTVVIGPLFLDADATQAEIDEAIYTGIGRALAFIMGASFSAFTGFYGMRMAVQANVRVASAAKRSMGEALQISYRAGTITGMLTDSLGLFGGTIIFVVYGQLSPEVLLGFGFGGTLIALFMRIGGGIYTKAADVGADLVGKVEQSLEEDDPRNAAVIADLVGDNVGDCAGMAADIFESYEVTIVASLILGLVLYNQTGSFIFVLYPLLVRTIGVFASIIGTSFVKAKGEGDNAFKAIERGYLTSATLSIVAFALLALVYIGLDPIDLGAGEELTFPAIRIFFATFSGIILAVLTNRLTDYYTGTGHAPVDNIARSSSASTATNILSGLNVGFESSAMAILLIAGSIFFSFIVFFGEGTVWILYGVGLAGIGQLTLTGNNVAMDAFGPIADNANGIAEMTDMDNKEARQILADLDAVGNTTKAITKGIAIASAVLAAVTLFGAFIEDVKKYTEKVTGTAVEITLDIADPQVFVGMLIGGAIPLLFSALAIGAVGRAASLIITEVRAQFKRPGVMEREVDPEYGKVVGICTQAAQKELITLGVITVSAPIIVGLFFNELTLGGFLAGVILSGQLMAVFQSNAGGAWDNAKKTIEDGIYGGKHSEAHKASVIGDTVGDPLKDTSGPALNPMIKVINLVSILLLPLVVEFSRLQLDDPVRITSYLIGGILLVVCYYLFRKSKKDTGFMIEN